MRRPPHAAAHDADPAAHPRHPERDAAEASLADRIVAALAASGRDLLDGDAIVARAHLERGERRAVAVALAGLVAAGTVVEPRAGRFALAARQHLRAGELQVHPDGYAFVGAPPPAGTPPEPDLYVPGAALRPAMHGDRVLASVERRRRGRVERLSGRIVQVLERRTTRLLGVVRHGRSGRRRRPRPAPPPPPHGRSGAYLIPQEPRVLYRVRLIDAGSARDGDMVIAAITRYPGAYEDLEARVETVLGPADDPRVETDAVIHAHDLPLAFPNAVLREAARLPRAVDCPPLDATLPEPARAPRPWHASVAQRERIDLRAVPLVTIDGENARDFDDAVAILDAPGGGTRLLVAIADVAAYVRRGSALDMEARARGTSVYFPDRVIPMLPEALSNGLCSLNPDVDRLVQAVLLDCDPHGRVHGAAFFPGVMRSRARLTYTEVRQIVADGDLATRRRYAALVDDLERMTTLAEAMAARRRARGSIDFDLPEAEIILDLRGHPENIVKAERNVAHRLIESFMLAANEAVASHLTAARVPLPYRIHEPPDDDALEELARFLEGFGVRLERQRGGVRPHAFQHALARVAGRPEERLINTVLLRTMKQARYAPLNVGHFGLAADCYTHFTSPIRRYPDLVLHRLLAAHLAGDQRTIDAIAAELPDICDESSRRERIAMEAEREVVQLKKVQFMQDKIGETYDGFVSGVVPFGLFVELETWFVEGLVHVATLTDDRYELVEERHLLRGRRRGRIFRVGDPVRVRVASVSIERKQIDFVLADDARPRI
jgi:ribonuclease R